VAHFAYPFGLFDERAVEAVEGAGYRTACSTRAGFNRHDEDRFLLRRIDVYGGDSLRRFRQKMRFGTNDASLTYPFRYYARRLGERMRL
jgi:hypothetical protein